MISYISQTVLIPSHAVAKCGVASGCPAFMGRLSPVLYRLVVPARHAENVTNLGADKILAHCRQDFTDVCQTIAVNISARRRPIKNWGKQKVITITVRYQFTYSRPQNQRLS
jgi:hypothetical protein